MSYNKESIRTFVIRSCLILFNIIGGIITARWLGPEGVGIFALLQLVSSACFRFGNLGFGSSLAYFTARGKLANNVSFLFAVKIGMLLSLSCMGIILLLWRQTFLPWHDIPVRLFYLSLLTVPPFFLNNYFNRLLTGQLRILESNISEIIRTAFYILGLVIMVVLFNLGIEGALYAHLIAQMAVTSFLILSLRKGPQSLKKDHENPAGFKDLIMKFWKYGRWNYLILMNRYLIDQLPMFFIKYFSSNEAVGLFNVARGLYFKIEMLPTTFANILFPFTAASDEDNAKNRTNSLCRIFSFIMVALVVFLSPIIKPALLLLYGEPFLPSVTVFYGLLPAIIFFPLFKFTNIHIAASGNSRLASFINFFSLPANILLCAYLVPEYGALGAAMSVSFNFGVSAAFSLFFYLRMSGSKLSDTLVLKKSDFSKLLICLHRLNSRHRPVSESIIQ